MNQGRVYFIGNGKSIKVGRTRDIESRMRALSTGSDRVLTLLATVNGGPAHEAKVHEELNQFRLNGEWFTDCPEIRAAIRRYQEHGIEVDAPDDDAVSDESEIVARCREGASLLIARLESQGLPKMEAYERVAREVGTNAGWLRKFISRYPDTREPRVSIGVRILECSGLLVRGTSEEILSEDQTVVGE